MEIWKDIENYEGMYQVSEKGRVKSLNYNHTKKEKILKGVKDKGGYLYVGLWKDGKQTNQLIHRLIAQAFIPNPNNYEQVNHKDENPSNNHVANLEWCDAKYNTNYGTRNQRSGEKLTNHPSMSKRVDQIDMITGEVIRQWASTRECGRNGYTQSHVSACARGELKKYKGYVWKYIRV
jgi:hypothetical protein